MSERPALAIVVDRFPCLSESFIRREIAALETMRLPVVVVSCVPRQECDHWAGSHCETPVIYGPGRSEPALPRNLPTLLARAFSALPPGASRPWHAGRSLRLALRLAPLLKARGVRHIHGHFLHRPGLITGLLADLLGASFSLSAHGRDVFVPEYHAASLCRGADFVSVCSEHARSCLLARLPETFPAPVHYCPHGVTIGRASPPRRRRAGEPLRLVSVCRLVRKKGIDVVLRALAQLQTEGLRYHYAILGEGPEAAGLATLSRVLRLEGVEFLGRRAPEEVREELRSAHALVLGCRTADDGDRDGIPNVILEAMEVTLPVIATDAGGVSEVICDRRTGWLPPADDPAAVAGAIREMATDEGLRLELARRGRLEVERRFDLRCSGEWLARLLSDSLGDRRQHPESAVR